MGDSSDASVGMGDASVGMGDVVMYQLVWVM